MTTDLLPFDGDNHDVALYLQVAQWIERNIAAHKFTPGSRLPTVRVLADHLGLNRGLVASAYAHLTKEGILRARVGKGTFVRTSLNMEGEQSHPAARGKQFWQPRLAEASVRIGLSKQPILESTQDSTWVPDHGEATHGRSQLPVDTPLADHTLSYRLIRETIEHLAGHMTKEMLAYSHPQGILSLRRHVSELAKRRNIIAPSNEIMITNGAQQALSLLSTLLLEPDDVVITENPSYLGAIRAFRIARANVIGIPVDAHGIRIDVLEGVLRNHNPKLIYTIPSFQAPTGVTQSPERRQQLYALAQKHKIPILEDEYVNDLYYGPPPPNPIKSIDTDQLVIYIGTFSKTLSASIRLGWISANTELISRLTQIKEVRDIHSSIFSQLIVDRILEDDLYEPLLANLRNHYRARYNAMKDQILEKLGLPLLESGYAGGFSIWARLPQSLSASDWLVYSRAKGVPFDNGLPYFVSAQPHEYARFCFSLLSLAEIQKATDVLTSTMRETQASQHLLEGGDRWFLPFS
jgi:GntR family transcriptional regulator of abcA and norABC